MITNKIEFNLVLTKISFVDYKDLYLLIIFSQLGMQILMVFGGYIYITVFQNKTFGITKDWLHSIYFFFLFWLDLHIHFHTPNLHIKS